MDVGLLVSRMRGEDPLEPKTFIAPLLRDDFVKSAVTFCLEERSLVERLIVGFYGGAGAEFDGRGEVELKSAQVKSSALLGALMPLTKFFLLKFIELQWC